MGDLVALIHGARGIHSFTSVDNHFGGFTKTIASGQTISMYDQGKATHTLLYNLARILNSPFALGFVSVSPHGYLFPTPEYDPLNGGIECCCHWYQGGTFTNAAGTFNNGFYIFADTRYGEDATMPVSATFTINSNATATTATVIGESRTIPIVSHQFTDSFASAATIHLYQIT